MQVFSGYNNKGRMKKFVAYKKPMYLGEGQQMCDIDQFQKVKEPYG